MGGKSLKRGSVLHRLVRKFHENKQRPIEVKSEEPIREDKETKSSHHHKKRHIYKRLFKIHHDFPPGIIMLLIFCAIIDVIYIALTSFFSFTVLSGVVILGPLSRFLNIIMILLFAFIIYGVSKKKLWSYYLTLFVFASIIFNSIISMFFVKKNVSGSLTLFVILSFFYILLMNLLSFWFVKSKKNYFLHHYHPAHLSKEDKSFIFSLTSLWVVFIFTAAVLGMSYYSETTEKIDLLVEELRYVTPYTVDGFCEKKGDDRDLCFLVSSVMFEKVINANTLCSQIDSDIYKYLCYKNQQKGLI